MPFFMRLALLAMFSFIASTAAAAPLDPASSAGQTKTRAFKMGFAPTPYDRSADADRFTRQFLAESADIVAIQDIDGVPWKEAATGKPLPAQITEGWRTKRNMAPRGASIFLSISPLNRDRSGIANSRGGGGGGRRDPQQEKEVVDEFKDKDFDDPVVMEAYFNYCVAAIETVKPDAICIAVGVNELYHKSPTRWDAYAKLHKAVYTELRKRYRKLPIFVSFSLHQMLNKDWRDRAQMVATYKDLMDYTDLIGISFFPYLTNMAYKTPQESLDWVEKEFGTAGKPFAFTETGQNAEMLESKTLNLLADGNDKDQEEFYASILNFASTHPTAMVVASLPRDYDALIDRMGDKAPEILKLWQDIGLIDGAGKPRPAYTVWRDWLKKPYKIEKVAKAK